MVGDHFQHMKTQIFSNASWSFDILLFLFLPCNTSFNLSFKTNAHTFALFYLLWGKQYWTNLQLVIVNLYSPQNKPLCEETHFQQSSQIERNSTKSKGSLRKQSIFHDTITGLRRNSIQSTCYGNWPFQHKSFQYNLKHWNNTKILITSSAVCAWKRKTSGATILHSLSQGCETIYILT